MHAEEGVRRSDQRRRAAGQRARSARELSSDHSGAATANYALNGERTWARPQMARQVRSPLRRACTPARRPLNPCRSSDVANEVREREAERARGATGSHDRRSVPTELYARRGSGDRAAESPGDVLERLSARFASLADRGTKARDRISLGPAGHRKRFVGRTRGGSLEVSPRCRPRNMFPQSGGCLESISAVPHPPRRDSRC